VIIDGRDRGKLGVRVSDVENQLGIKVMRGQGASGGWNEKNRSVKKGFSKYRSAHGIKQSWGEEGGAS